VSQQITITFKEIVDIAYANKQDKSLRQRLTVLYDIIKPDTKVENFTNKMIIDISNKLLDRGITGSTVNRYLSILSKVARIYRKYSNPHFTLFIPWHKEGNGRMEWLKSDEEDKLHGHLGKKDPDLSLIVRILTSTGMRISEFTSLEASQIEDGWIRLWNTKTSRPRSVPIQAGIDEQLRQLIVKGIPKAHTIRRGLKAALRASGINSRITPHSLRHTTATRLIKSGVNLLVAGKFLGHNSLRTTQRYVHIDDEDIRAAMGAMERNNGTPKDSRERIKSLQG
jgi:integrase